MKTTYTICTNGHTGYHAPLAAHPEICGICNTPRKVISEDAYQAIQKLAERIRFARLDFLQSEGYLETSAGMTECQTFDQYWILINARQPYRTTEPWQKGDLGYGLS